MRIVHLAAEFAPVAKAGGLGEVVLGLAREQTRLHHDVSVFLPKYHHLRLPFQLDLADFKSFEKGRSHANALWSASVEGCHLYFVEARHPAGYFHRGSIYGEADDTARFLYFCRAVCDYLRLTVQEPIDILHLHDWHTAIAALIARDLLSLPIQAIVLHIHNIEYQGICATWDLDAIGLQGAHYAPQLQDPTHPGSLNLLKAGLLYADKIIAVSPTYASEILTPRYAHGLAPLLQEISPKLTGVLNGIDYTLWNPRTDPHLPAHYDSASSPRTIQASKRAARLAVASAHHLDPNGRPWFGAITRLVAPKGPELLIDALRFLDQAGASFFLLGTPSPALLPTFTALQAEYANHPRICVRLAYDDQLAHLLYAALDYTLVPSHAEPCGLTQLIGMRYGTVPIVHPVGGLKDTVIDCDDSSKPASQRNGLTFSPATPSACRSTLDRALSLFRSDPASYAALQKRGLAADFSWQRPTQEILKIYRSLLKKIGV